MRDVLTAMIKAHEIQGILALENSFNRVGLDHVILVKVASTAVVTRLLGGTRSDIIQRYPMHGLTAIRCAPIGIRRIQVRENHGQPAMRRAVPFGSR